MLQCFILYTQNNVWGYTLLATYSITRGISMSQLITDIITSDIYSDVY